MNDKVVQFPIMTGADAVPRLAMIIWGLYNTGKTTWAATAPGDKLYLSFGDNEHVTVMHRKDVKFINLANKTPEEVFRHGIGPNPFGLDRILYENKGIKTLVVDSLTVVEQLGLEKAVLDGVGKSRDFSPTMQVPGRGAYGGRNQNLMGLVKSLLQVTGKHGVHIIFTGHENDPQTKSDSRGGDTLEVINMALTSKLLNTVSSSLSEVWNLRLEPGGRRNRIITTRVSGYRRPMKTRMFDQKGEASFVLQYDPDRPDTDPDQMTIAKFYNQWVKGGMRRILIPNNRRGGDVGDNAEQRLKGTV
jgi:AAA domain